MFGNNRKLRKIIILPRFSNNWPKRKLSRPDIIMQTFQTNFCKWKFLEQNFLWKLLETNCETFIDFETFTSFEAFTSFEVFICQLNLTKTEPWPLALSLVMKYWKYEILFGLFYYAAVGHVFRLTRLRFGCYPKTVKKYPQSN